MQSQLKRYVAYSMLALTLLMPATAATAQQNRVRPINDQLPIKETACPHPITVTLTATNPPNVVASNFSAGELAGQVGLNDSGTNTHFLSTFQWKRDQRCCQITRALLTVVIKANQGGSSLTSSDAGNDGISIIQAGNSIQGEPIYNNTTFPFNAGLIVTKSLTLNAAALSYLNNSGFVNLYVQDDSGVQSATLQLWGCCLTSRSPAEEQTSNPQQ
jgi:hypothetical protein